MAEERKRAAWQAALLVRKNDEGVQNPSLEQERWMPLIDNYPEIAGCHIRH